MGKRRGGGRDGGGGGREDQFGDFSKGQDREMNSGFSGRGGRGGGTAGNTRGKGMALNFQRNVPKFLQQYSHLLGGGGQANEDDPVVEGRGAGGDGSGDEEEEEENVEVVRREAAGWIYISRGQAACEVRPGVVCGVRASGAVGRSASRVMGAARCGKWHLWSFARVILHLLTRQYTLPVSASKLWQQPRGAAECIVWQGSPAYTTATGV